MLWFLVRCAVVVGCFLSVSVAMAQETARFGAWKAYCAPVAGCVMGTKSGEGDTLALVDPPSGNTQTLLFLAEPVQAGAEIALAVDGVAFAVLDSVQGWRRVDAGVGLAVELDSVFVDRALVEQMRRRARLGVTYLTTGGAERRLTFSLNGFADTRGYVDTE